MKIPEWFPAEQQMATLGRHSWSVARLIQLSKDLPVMTIPLDALCINYPYEKLRMREMVMHMKAVNAANLKYPIILDEDGEIMDGCHRIMKALLLGKKTIKAVRFDTNPEPDKVKE
jgi:hypothetical protein